LHRYSSRGIFAEKKKKTKGVAEKGEKRVCICVSLSQRQFAMQLFNTVPVMTRSFHLPRGRAQNRSLDKKKFNLNRNSR